MADKSAYFHEHYIRTKDKRRARKKVTSKYAAARRRETDLLWRYGLGPEQLNQLLAAQGNACAICRHVFDGEGKQGTPHIDHLHDRGKARIGTVRGILCNNCNRSLGGFKDNPEALRAAIEYLANPPAYALFPPKPQLKLFEEPA